MTRQPPHKGWLDLNLRPLHQTRSSRPSHHWLPTVRVQRPTSTDPDRELIVLFVVLQVRGDAQERSTFSLYIRELRLSFHDLAVLQVQFQIHCRPKHH